MNDIVLIGKVTGSTPNLVQLEYPSVNGIHSVRLPRDMVARFERISKDRVVALVRTDESERGQLRVSVYQFHQISYVLLHQPHSD